MIVRFTNSYLIPMVAILRQGERGNVEEMHHIDTKLFQISHTHSISREAADKVLGNILILLANELCLIHLSMKLVEDKLSPEAFIDLCLRCIPSNAIYASMHSVSKTKICWFSNLFEKNEQLLPFYAIPVLSVDIAHEICDIECLQRTFFLSNNFGLLSIQNFCFTHRECEIANIMYRFIM